MAILNLYSKRKRAAAKAGQPDVYRYDVLPQEFRVQVIHLLRDLFGTYSVYADRGIEWRVLHDDIARDKGKFQLAATGNPQTNCEQYLLLSPVDEALDMIEYAFGGIESFEADRQEAIEELNARFREHSVGYQFSGGIIVRVDSEYVHAEVIQPALALLSSPSFAAANEEFLAAHQHYREGRHKDAIVAANRAFETTLKTICTERGWPFKPGDRASELITIVRTNGLFPDYLDRGLDTYVALLKTGLPGVRNNAGGHGAEPAAPTVPEYMAAHALHLTAANIVLLVEAFDEK